MALQHGDMEVLFDTRLSDDLAQSDDTLAAETACHDFYAIFHIFPVLLILSTVSWTNSWNSGLELLASCQTPVAQMVSSFSCPRGAEWDLIQR